LSRATSKKIVWSYYDDQFIGKYLPLLSRSNTRIPMLQVFLIYAQTSGISTRNTTLPEAIRGKSVSFNAL